MKKRCIITKTCLYNADPLKPHFYIVKLGFTGLLLGEAVLTSTHNLCFWADIRKILEFLSENFNILLVNFPIYLNRPVFVMLGYSKYAKWRFWSDCADLIFRWAHIIEETFSHVVTHFNFIVVFGLEPSFDVPIINVTVQKGDTAVLPCSVDFLGDHKVRFRSFIVLHWKDE